MLRALTSLFCTTLPLATLGCLIPLTAKAQIAADGTTSTTVNQNGDNFTIEQGDRLGDNLFHSFNEFSVPTLGSASFNNPTDIVNIFSRITGNNISDIDGLISANGAANLFLINPNGIIFGENASLNLGGSFLASTADSLLFDENTEFSATNPQPPLLEVNIPIGLNFQNNPEEIVNRSMVKNSAGDSVGLEVAPGENLTLVGGDINFETGNTTAKGGNIQLGGLSAAGTVGINEDGSLNFSEDVAQADITLSNAADVDVFGTGGGSITINARNLNLEAGDLGRSFIRGGITADSTSAAAQAGDITINATDNVSVDNSLIVNQVLSEAEGNSGSVNISTDSLTLTNRGNILSSVGGKGTGGLVSINVADEISLDSSGILANVEADAIGKAGDIEITTTNLALTNGSAIISLTQGIGDAGQISLDVASTISAEGGGIFSSVEGENSQGNAGGIEINTANLSLTNGAQISGRVLGKGTGGLVSINAADKLSLDSSLILANLEADATGKAGDINITTTSLALNGSIIAAVTQGIGDAGQISLDVASTISAEGGGIFSSVSGENSQGNAGDIDITTTNLNLTNGSAISASTSGIGDAGQIFLDVASTISAEDSTITSNMSGENSQGNAGGIEIDTANLYLTNDAEVSSGVSGKGTGGLVSINVADEISLDSSSILTNAGADATGKAGDIDITTTNLNLTNDSAIAASTRGIGDAGQVSLDVASTISAEGGGIFSNVLGKNSQSNGSGIKINTANLSLTNGGAVSTVIQGGGNASNITINARESIFISGLNENNFRSGIAASARTVNGIAGNVDIFTNQLTIEDGAGISVSSPEGLAGNLKITANSLFQNGGIITSETRLNDEDTGANIDIQIAELWLLENESLVSATAFGIADGGNINIDTEFIVAFPNQNNDIIANAEQGIGGNINITAESLFGLAERSSTPPNSTNDIDASSEFGLDGDISIDTPDVDPARGLEKLPTDIVDASRLITRTCLGGGDSDELNEFVVTGRGGIPSNPNESLPGDATLSAEWLTLPETTRDSRELPMREESSQSEKSMPQIVEAKGWVINTDGNVVLTATANTPQLSVPWLVPNACSNF